MKASDLLKKKGSDKKSDGGGNKLMDWIGKRRGKVAKADKESEEK